MDKLNAAKKIENQDMIARASMEIRAKWKEHGVNPFGAFKMILVQGPLFVSFFFALRSMADARLPSLINGGGLWFSDLSAADPMHILPFLASGGMLLTIELGSDGMNMDAAKTMKERKMAKQL